MKKIKKHKQYVGTKTLEVLEGANDYNAWIGESISPFLSAPLLEVGAGIGNISKFFLHNEPFYISDTDKDLVNFLKEKFAKKSSVKVISLNVENSPAKNLQGKFASIVAINVLEHIEEDIRSLKNMKIMLKKKGKLILLVPAKKRAYTRLDKSLGHFRRYEKKELQEKIIHAGFVIEKIYFFNFLGIFTWVLRDKISQTHTHLSPRHISLFDKIVKVLKIIERCIPIPIGISLVVVAKKP